MRDMARQFVTDAFGAPLQRSLVVAGFVSEHDTQRAYVAGIGVLQYQLNFESIPRFVQSKMGNSGLYDPQVVRIGLLADSADIRRDNYIVAAARRRYMHCNHR